MNGKIVWFVCSHVFASSASPNRHPRRAMAIAAVFSSLRKLHLHLEPVIYADFQNWSTGSMESCLNRWISCGYTFMSWQYRYFNYLKVAISVYSRCKTICNKCFLCIFSGHYSRQRQNRSQESIFKHSRSQGSKGTNVAAADPQIKATILYISGSLLENHAECSDLIVSIINAC